MLIPYYRIRTAVRNKRNLVGWLAVEQKKMNRNPLEEGPFGDDNLVHAPISVQDVFAKMVPPFWEQSKDKGNAFLKDGSYDEAIEAYTEAFEIAIYPEGHLEVKVIIYQRKEASFITLCCLQAFKSCMLSFPGGSPQAFMVTTEPRTRFF